MRTLSAETKARLLGSALLLCSPLLTVQAGATSSDEYTWTSPVGHVSVRIAGNHRGRPHGSDPQAANAARGGTQSSGISCVPYAREVSGILVAGNASQWWDNASGQYARGYRPEPGSVLTFRGNGRMRLGHVAVVRRVLNGREVEGMADPDDVARDMLDNLPEGPTFPPDPTPFGPVPRRQAVELMSQGAARLHG